MTPFETIELALQTVPDGGQREHAMAALDELRRNADASFQTASRDLARAYDRAVEQALVNGGQ
jgi:hypothetical protein